MERKPIFIQRQSIQVEREPIELYYEEWLPVYWHRYGDGVLLHFPNYLINYRGQIKKVSTDALINIYPAKKESVVMYLDGYAYCINLEDIIQASILDKLNS